MSWDVGLGVVAVVVISLGLWGQYRRSFRYRMGRLAKELRSAQLSIAVGLLPAMQKVVKAAQEFAEAQRKAQRKIQEAGE